MMAAAKQVISGPEPPKRKNEAARDHPPLLSKGLVLQNLFEIEEQFGGGGFGQIYKVHHREFGQKMALKVEPARGDVRRAKLEMTVMMMLRGKPHIPIMYGCGKVNGCPYIVMQMLGRNLSDLRRRQPDRCLSASTVFRVSVHVVIALRHLHESGYVHRDVKPSNCCMGVGTARRKCHVIDFGMVRRIRDMDGTLRPPRKYAPFRGTVRYVSIAMHQRKDVGPGDDLIGWFYAMLELLNGGLPWSSFEKTTDILKSKTDMVLKDFCDAHPKGLLAFATHVMNLQYHNIPKYDFLQKTLKTSLPVGITDASPYDWEVPPAHVAKKSTRQVERSMMCSVGTELPQPINVLPPRRGTKRGLRKGAPTPPGKPSGGKRSHPTPQERSKSSGKCSTDNSKPSAPSQSPAATDPPMQPASPAAKDLETIPVDVNHESHRRNDDDDVEPTQEMSNEPLPAAKSHTGGGD
uniref:non-specific serine/threonine protein kinase n=1 Tax=Panagrellus redivivus TaxID=6233 RepID=A0A7E4VYJ1_PANRE